MWTTPSMKTRAPDTTEIEERRFAIVRRRTGTTKTEGEGDASVGAAAFPKGDEPLAIAVDMIAAATETPRCVIALPLSASSGVVGSWCGLGKEVEELTDRCHHAGTPFSPWRGSTKS